MSRRSVKSKDLALPGPATSPRVFSPDPEQQGIWNVQLHADHLDATELDRWFGPRARPGWVQRLLPSLFSGKAQTVPASELVRRLNIAGNVQVDEFTIEKLKLQQLHLQGSLHDLQLNVFDGRAQWAGGTVRATMLAKFLPRPAYDVHAQLDGVNLTQLPIDALVTDRLAGSLPALYTSRPPAWAATNCCKN